MIIRLVGIKLNWEVYRRSEKRLFKLAGIVTENNAIWDIWYMAFIIPHIYYKEVLLKLLIYILNYNKILMMKLLPIKMFVVVVIVDVDV